MKFQISAAAVTHTGHVRSNNEDNYYLCGQIREDVSVGESKHTFSGGTKMFLAAVCDGMGGENFGERASLLAVQTLKPSRWNAVRETARTGVRQANSRICAEIEKNGGGRMGSTLAALYIDEEKAISCNVGDSRVYHLRGGSLRQLSTDHNKARRLVELGVLTPEQAAKHHSRHELTQHLGIFEHELVLEPAFSEEIELIAGDIFLLCSDGLTDMVSETEITARLTGGGTPEEQAKDLIQMALAAGGKDNVTVLILHIGGNHCSAWQRIISKLEWDVTGRR